MGKIYNVRVYKIGHSFDIGEMYELKDRALVKKTILGVKEIITGEPLKKVQNKMPDDSSFFTGDLDFFTYEKKGCVLGVLKEDLNEKNIATRKDLIKYVYTFKGTKLCEKIMNMRDKDEKEKEKIKKRLDKIETKLINEL